MITLLLIAIVIIALVIILATFLGVGVICLLPIGDILIAIVIVIAIIKLIKYLKNRKWFFREVSDVVLLFFLFERWWKQWYTQLYLL